MFERFTDRARFVVVEAQSVARRWNHDYIGTEHILYGLAVAQGIAKDVLEEFGVDTQIIEAGTDELVGKGQSPPTGHIPFTPRAKKALEYSLREALQLGHNYIGTEHVFLGVLREGSVSDGGGGVANTILTRYATVQQYRQAVVKILANYAAPAESTPATEALRNMYQSVAQAFGVSVSSDLLDFLAYQQVSVYDFEGFVRESA